MSKSPIKPQRLVAVFLAGVLLLDYPLLPLFNGDGTCSGYLRCMRTSSSCGVY